MVVVPEFLIKRIYQKGSLKRTDDGASVTLKNVLGPGFISGFNYVKINDVIATIHTNKENYENIIKEIKEAFVYTNEKVKTHPVVHKVVE